MANIWPGVYGVLTHLLQQRLVLIRIQQRESLCILLISQRPTFFVLTVSKAAPSRMQMIFIFLYLGYSTMCAFPRSDIATWNLAQWISTERFTAIPFYGRIDSMLSRFRHIQRSVSFLPTLARSFSVAAESTSNKFKRNSFGAE